MPRLYDALYRAARNSRLADAAAGLAVRIMPDVAVVRRVNHVGKLAFSLKRHHWLLGRDCFEGHRRTLALFARQVRPGDVLYDIGANIGYYMRFVAQHFPVARIVAFEPMTANLRLLRRNAGLCPDPSRIAVVAAALSDEDGEAELQVDDVSDGSAVLSRISGGAPSGGRAAKGLPAKVERVRQMRVDSYVFRATGWAQPDPCPHGSDVEQSGHGSAFGRPVAREFPPYVLKLDTEGAEHLVLAGATHTLAELRPRLILAMHGHDRARQVLAILEAAGYTTAGWLAGGGGLAWGRITSENVAAMADNNCIASANPADVLPPVEPVDLSRYPTPP